MKQDKYYIWICKYCEKQLLADDMGKRCLHCENWAYNDECMKEVIIKS